MSFIQLETLDDKRSNVIQNLSSVVNELGIRLKNISENTLSLEQIQERSLEKLCTDIDKGISASEEFELHCEILSQELDGIENLGKAISLMRKQCEDLEKKILKHK